MADLDGDGVLDLVSGSYTGGVSFFRGDGDGGFHPERKLGASGGGTFSDRHAQSPSFADWDGDGDWDLVLGFIDGPVLLYVNLGGLVFDQGRPLTAGGRPITAEDARPHAVDWDGDGVTDLLLGSASGSVGLFRGTALGSVSMIRRPPLIAPWPDPSRLPEVSFEPTARRELRPRRPGLRPTPSTADWNGDGKLDLIVGDFVVVVGPDPELTPAQRLLRQKLRKDLEAVNKRIDHLTTSHMERARNRLGLGPPETWTTEERDRLHRAASDIRDGDQEFSRLVAQSGEVCAKLEGLEPRKSPGGLVWILLRR